MSKSIPSKRDEGLPKVFGFDLENARQLPNRRRVRARSLAGLDRRDRRPPYVGELGKLDLSQTSTLPVLFKTRQIHEEIIPISIDFTMIR